MTTATSRVISLAIETDLDLWLSTDSHFPDRSIQEKDFGRIQIDRVAEMQKSAANIRAVEG